MKQGGGFTQGQKRAISTTYAIIFYSSKIPTFYETRSWQHCSSHCRRLPNHMEMRDCSRHKAFCGIYSKSGDVFMSAYQGTIPLNISSFSHRLHFLNKRVSVSDRTIRLYNTTCGNFKKFKTIVAQNVGWSVLDVAFR